MNPSIQSPTQLEPWALIRQDLVSFVTKRVESREVAEDIVQDVYERLQRSGPNSIANPKAWLYRAARNATIDHYRLRKVDSPLDEQALEKVLPVSIDDEGPNEATRELALCLRALIAQLPVKHRIALTLVDLDGHTQREAATIEKISESGMKSRVQRGRVQLGALLSACCTVSVDPGGAIYDYAQTAENCDCP